MELTATNRSQAYPSVEEGRSAKAWRTSEAKTEGLKRREKRKKDLQKSERYSILYVVLKVC